MKHLLILACLCLMSGCIEEKHNTLPKSKKDSAKEQASESAQDPSQEQIERGVFVDVAPPEERQENDQQTQTPQPEVTAPSGEVSQDLIRVENFAVIKSNLKLDSAIVPPPVEPVPSDDKFCGVIYRSREQQVRLQLVSGTTYILEVDEAKQDALTNLRFPADAQEGCAFGTLSEQTNDDLEKIALSALQLDALTVHPERGPLAQELTEILCGSVTYSKDYGASSATAKLKADNRTYDVVEPSGMLPVLTPYLELGQQYQVCLYSDRAVYTDYSLGYRRRFDVKAVE